MTVQTTLNTRPFGRPHTSFIGPNFDLSFVFISMSGDVEGKWCAHWVRLYLN